MRMILLAFSATALSGCIAKTAFDIVTLPVRAAVTVVDQSIDAVTTSQGERDRAAGRRLREEDERRGREARAEERRAREAARRGETADPVETEPK